MLLRNRNPLGEWDFSWNFSAQILKWTSHSVFNGPSKASLEKSRANTWKNWEENWFNQFLVADLYSTRGFSYHPELYNAQIYLCLVKIKNRKAPTSYISCSYIAFTVSSLLPLNRVFNKNHARLFPKKVKPSQDFCPEPFLEFNRLSKRQILLAYVGSQTQRTLRT